MTINDLQNLHDKKEWDFILKETQKGYKENRIKREILFTLQLELSKPKPNMDFYKEIKEKYLSLKD